MTSTIPTEFPDVTAVCKANVYFDGKVVSHTLRFADGSKKTLGLIFPGEYHFGTGAPEKMEIVAGNCRVKLDGGGSWQDHGAGALFRVPGNSGFSIAVADGIVEYVCSFE
jgi:purine/pyrimidine-nucleoside phosphorylase